MLRLDSPRVIPFVVPVSVLRLVSLGSSDRLPNRTCSDVGFDAQYRRKRHRLNGAVLPNQCHGDRP